MDFVVITDHHRPDTPATDHCHVVSPQHRKPDSPSEHRSSGYAFISFISFKPRVFGRR